jgi:hypothetical protein
LRRSGRRRLGAGIRKEIEEMTLLWFIVWVIADHIGSHEALRFDPVNVWMTTLLLAVALDLGRAHAARPGRS